MNIKFFPKKLIIWKVITLKTLHYFIIIYKIRDWLVKCKVIYQKYFISFDLINISLCLENLLYNFIVNSSYCYSFLICYNIFIWILLNYNIVSKSVHTLSHWYQKKHLSLSNKLLPDFKSSLSKLEILPRRMGIFTLHNILQIIVYWIWFYKSLHFIFIVYYILCSIDILE